MEWLHREWSHSVRPFSKPSVPPALGLTCCRRMSQHRCVRSTDCLSLSSLIHLSTGGFSALTWVLNRTNYVQMCPSCCVCCLAWDSLLPGALHSVPSYAGPPLTCRSVGPSLSAALGENRSALLWFARVCLRTPSYRRAVGDWGTVKPDKKRAWMSASPSPTYIPGKEQHLKST